MTSETERAADNCLLIPVHPPKANWLLAMLQSLDGRRGAAPLDFDIVLAVTDAGHRAFFEGLRRWTPAGAPFRIMVVEDYLAGALGDDDLLHALRTNRYRGIINLKKLLALRWAAEAGYAYTACIDADVLVVADLAPLFAELRENYGRGLYLAGVRDEPMIEAILRGCRLLFNGVEQEQVFAITGGDRYYPWFFDVPVYRADDYLAFLDHMAARSGSLADFLRRINLFSFEHVIFVIWRALTGAATLVPYGEHGVDNLPESLSGADSIRLAQITGYQPSWLAAAAVFHSHGVLEALPRTRLLYHFDRL